MSSGSILTPPPAPSSLRVLVKRVQPAASPWSITQRTTLRIALNDVTAGQSRVRSLRRRNWKRWAVSNDEGWRGGGVREEDEEGWGRWSGILHHPSCGFAKSSCAIFSSGSARGEEDRRIHSANRCDSEVPSLFLFHFGISMWDWLRINNLYLIFFLLLKKIQFASGDYWWSLLKLKHDGTRVSLFAFTSSAPSPSQVARGEDFIF